MFFILFYRFGIWLYFLWIRCMSFFHPKAKDFVEGRKETWKKLLEFSQDISQKVYWFHCASLGEYEQVKPILAELKIRSPKDKIVLTFFSPSGFNAAQNSIYADLVLYLPKDTLAHAKKFIKILKPHTVVFVKYELWFYFLSEAKRSHAQLFLVSARFHNGGVMHIFSRAFYLSLLAMFDKIITQDANTFRLLQGFKLKNVVQGADTRVDRVLQLANAEFNTDFFVKFIDGKKCLIAGSSWQKEEELLLDWMKNYDKDCKVIIAPHEIRRRNQIATLFKEFSPCMFTENENCNFQNSRVLIIDTIGVLSKMYRVGDYAFVGGGFANALHNVFEPAVYGIPVFFGNKTAKFSEVEILTQAGLGFPIQNAKNLSVLLQKIEVQVIKSKSKQFFEQHAGISKQIVNELIK